MHGELHKRGWACLPNEYARKSCLAQSKSSLRPCFACGYNCLRLEV
nr:MAG TPA: hypothetical protein [Caudoviricetes sp.]